jgi:kumamolisin
MHGRLEGKRLRVQGLIVAAALVLPALGVQAQEGSTGYPSPEQISPRTPQAGYVYVPESDKEQPGHFHTDYLIRSSDGSKPPGMATPLEAAAALIGPDVVTSGENGEAAVVSTVMVAETPQSLGCLYVQSPYSPGCIPNRHSGSGGPSSAGYGAIALVDYGDNPDAATDLITFDSYWGLEAASFTKIYANGNGDCTAPSPNVDNSVEESLDIEWAHVFAPKAAIILVEACSNSSKDLFYAEEVAFNYIVTHYPEGGQVSNSFGASESALPAPTQISDDPLFADFHYNGAKGYVTHILAFASAGDRGFGAQYPSTNPWIISAGGTSVLRNASTLEFVSESCWSGSGGGPSAIETYATSFTGGNMGPWADFQYAIFGKHNRVTPDLSFDADTASGVLVYSKYGAGGWTIVGGTSVSSPALAGIINRAGSKLGSEFLTSITGGDDAFNAEENNLLYSQLATATAYHTNFYDITTGSNGSPAVASYDECTGVGSPRGLLGK